MVWVEYLPRRIVRSIRIARRQLEWRRWRSRVALHTYHRSSLQVLLPDATAASWYDHNWPVMGELELLSQHGLDATATVFEIGAHQGIVGMILASVASKGVVVCLEPVEHNYTAMLKNLSMNNITNIIPICACAAATPGALEFALQSNGGILPPQSSVASFLVEATTVDLLSDKYGFPNVIFVDVEGAEEMVLSGASRTLKEIESAFIEVHVGAGLEGFGSSSADVLRHFPINEFDRWISSGPGYEHDAAEEYRFVPWEPDHPIMRNRFFLVAARHRARELVS